MVWNDMSQENFKKEFFGDVGADAAMALREFNPSYIQRNFGYFNRFPQVGDHTINHSAMVAEFINNLLLASSK